MIRTVPALVMSLAIFAVSSAGICQNSKASGASCAAVYIALEENADQAQTAEILKSLSVTKSIDLPKKQAVISFCTLTAEPVYLEIAAESGETIFRTLFASPVPDEKAEFIWHGEINRTTENFISGHIVCGGIYTVRFVTADGRVSAKKAEIKVKTKISPPKSLSIYCYTGVSQPYGLDIEVPCTNVTAKWDSVEYASGYRFELYCGSKRILLRELCPGCHGLDISDEVRENGYTRYSFSVTALGGGYSSSSEKSSSGDLFIKNPYGDIALDSGYYDSFFNNSALLGDSVSDGLRMYASRQRSSFPGFLGDMVFLTATSYNLSYACGNSTRRSIKYQGVKMSPEDALCKIGAEKVFILLGTNDVFRAPESNIAKYEKLINNIRAKNPDILIFVLGVTPVVKSRERSGFKNSRVDSLNQAIWDMCARLGLEYIDMNKALRNGGPGLYPAYSSDRFVHLSSAGLGVYVNELRTAALNYLNHTP